MVKTVNSRYLEFIHFSLGASGMVRQDLQNNDTVPLNVFSNHLHKKQGSERKAQLWLRLGGTAALRTAHFLDEEVNTRPWNSPQEQRCQP